MARADPGLAKGGGPWRGTGGVVPSGVQGQSPGAESGGGAKPPEAAKFLYIFIQKGPKLRT